MANYYSQTVFQQTIPLSDITPLELLLLCQIFNYDKGETEIYFYAEDGINDTIWLDAAAIREAIDTSGTHKSFALTHLTTHYATELAGDDEVEIDVSDSWWQQICQDIIARSATIDQLTLCSGYTCGKMRPDGFGGMAMLITAQQVRVKSTYDLHLEFRAEAEANGEVAPEPLTALQIENAERMAQHNRAAEIQTMMKRLHDLDCAVVIFTPEELGAHTPIHKLESHLIEYGWPFINEYKGEDGGDV